MIPFRKQKALTLGLESGTLPHVRGHVARRSISSLAASALRRGRNADSFHRLFTSLLWWRVVWFILLPCTFA